jgi:hypothetical protein
VVHVDFDIMVSKRGTSEKASVEKPTVTHAKAHGIVSTKMNLRYQRSWPDRIFWMPLYPWYVEFKKKSKEPTVLQAAKIEELRALGYEVEVHDNKEEAVAAFDAALARREAEWFRKHNHHWRPEQLTGGALSAKSSRPVATTYVSEAGGKVRARNRRVRFIP